MVATAARYDAFLSYSHAGDADLAAALQRALPRIGVPWYRPAQLRVFRDQTSLAAAPELWGTIVEHLSRSDRFVLMASPAAAGSRWVDDEVAWWAAHRSLQQLLIVVCAGSLVRDADGRGFDPARTDCLPPTLLRQLRVEPLWVDLRPLPGQRTLQRRSARFRDGALTLAAALHGKSKDELDNAELRATRRSRLAAGIAFGSVVVSIGSALWLAGDLRDTSQRADGSWREAQSRRLSKLALDTLAEKNTNEAIQLAVLAWRLEPTDEAEDALRRIEAASAAVAHIIGAHSGHVRALAFSGDSSQLASVSEEGSILLWKVREPGAAPKVLASGFGPLSGADSPQLRFTADGRLLLWNGRGTAEVFDLAKGQRTAGLPSPSTRSLDLVRMSDDGARLVAVDSGRPRMWDVRRGVEVALPASLNDPYRPIAAVVPLTDGRLLFVQALQNRLRLLTWTFGDATVVSGPATPLDYTIKRPAGLLCLSPNGRWLGFQAGQGSQFELWQVDAGLSLRRAAFNAKVVDAHSQFPCTLQNNGWIIGSEASTPRDSYDWEHWRPGTAWQRVAAGNVPSREVAWSTDRHWRAHVERNTIVLTTLDPDTAVERGEQRLQARCDDRLRDGQDACWRSLCRKVAPSIDAAKLRGLFSFNDAEVFDRTFKGRVDAALCGPP